MTPTKDLSIIIINYKTASHLRQCIKSIKKHAPKMEYEIIVVDNNSQDLTVQMVEDDFMYNYKNQKISNVELIANKKNLGFPKAVNQGVKMATGKYILLLNPDITILEDSLEKMMAYLKQHPEVAVLGPKLINPNGSIQLSCFNKFTSPELVLYRRTSFGRLNHARKMLDDFTMKSWDHLTEKNVAWILGSCMLISKKAIDEVGIMDERFFMYMEDVDWCRRFWKAGYKVRYYPEVKMVHYYARASSSESGLVKAMLKKQTRTHITSALKFFLKYFGQKDEQYQSASK